MDRLLFEAVRAYLGISISSPANALPVQYPMDSDR
jgi:hypothetical protein